MITNFKIFERKKQKTLNIKELIEILRENYDVEYLTNVLKDFLKNKNINKKYNIYGYKKTLLSIAAHYNLASVVDILLEMGANPNLSDKDGYPPLYDAIKHKYMQIVELLVKSDKINLNRVLYDDVHKTSTTTYISATFTININTAKRILKLLFEYGAKPTIRDLFSSIWEHKLATMTINNCDKNIINSRDEDNDNIVDMLFETGNLNLIYPLMRNGLKSEYISQYIQNFSGYYKKSIEFCNNILSKKDDYSDETIKTVELELKKLKKQQAIKQFNI